ncbi:MULTISPECIES: hypothetical protein [Agrobacterium]|uniref:hypothetical protein n=1 Tax=Agrobacterium TaxID=357 RepID=UPI000DD09958|nr:MULTISPECIES: hypothetical protein [Agrobacterium]UHS55981.1 hypothetical protein HRS00_03705 [Agrobacterium vaccinii]
MHLTICLILLLLVSGIFNAVSAAQLAGAGAWGEASSILIVGPLFIFFGVHAIIYYGLRLVREPSKLKSFSNTKLTYIAFAVALMGIFGDLAQRSNPPL